MLVYRSVGMFIRGQGLPPPSPESHERWSPANNDDFLKHKYHET